MSAGGIDNPEGYQVTPEADNAKHLLGNRYSPPDPLDEFIVIDGGGINPTVLTIREFLEHSSKSCGACGKVADLANAGRHAEAARKENTFPTVALRGATPDSNKLGHSHQWRFLTIRSVALPRAVRPLAKRVLFSFDCVQRTWWGCNWDAVALVRVGSEYEERLRINVAEEFRIGLSNLTISESTLAAEDWGLLRPDLVPAYCSPWPIMIPNRKFRP